MESYFTLCHMDEIPEAGSKGFRVNNTALFAVKQQGRIYLYRNECPHIGVSLEWIPDQFLDSSKTLIQCANHGALFSIDNGKCIAGPCSGKSLTQVPFEIVDSHIRLTASSTGD